MTRENYISYTPTLLKSFDRAISLVKHILVTRYGEEADILIQESRKEYENLIPQIPYIGEKSPLRDVFFFPATRHLGIFKAFTKRGKTLEEVGRLVYDIGNAEINNIPYLIRKMVGFIWFSPWFKKN